MSDVSNSDWRLILGSKMNLTNKEVEDMLDVVKESREEEGFRFY
jgi:hypothetical protein